MVSGAYRRYLEVTMALATGAALLLYGDVLPLWGGAFARNKRRLQHYLEAAACFLAKDENRLK